MKNWRGVSGLARSVWISIGTALSVFAVDSRPGRERATVGVPLHLTYQAIAVGDFPSDTCTLVLSDSPTSAQAKLVSNIIVATSAGTIALPAASGMAGAFVIVTAMAAVTVTGPEASASLVSGQSALFLCNGSSWVSAKFVAPS